MIKEHRLKFQPQTSLYFNLFIGDSVEELHEFANTKMSQKCPKKYLAFCDRNYKGNLIGQIFLCKGYFDLFSIFHEAHHLVTTFQRREILEGRSSIADYVFRFETEREEEIASTKEWCAANILIATGMMDKSQLDLAEKRFLFSKEDYGWDSKNKKTYDIDIEVLYKKLSKEERLFLGIDRA